MKYNSTRDKSCRVSAAYAIAHGLAPDGGLFVPEELPPLSLQQIEALCKTDYRGRAEEITNRLAAVQPLFMDVLPLNLEEIFIYEQGGAENEVRDIIL